MKHISIFLSGIIVGALAMATTKLLGSALESHFWLGARNEIKAGRNNFKAQRNEIKTRRNKNQARRNEIQIPCPAAYRGLSMG